MACLGQIASLKAKLDEKGQEATQKQQALDDFIHRQQRVNEQDNVLHVAYNARSTYHLQTTTLLNAGWRRR